MYLYLVQHAEAKRKEEDPERHLTEKGGIDTKKIAEFVSKHTDIRVSCILHSGKTRAQQTAEILAEYLSPSPKVEETEGLEPLVDPSIWTNRLTEMKEDIVLVGHLPHLSKLSAFLLCQDENKKIVDFQMGGIVCLRRDEEGSWAVHWMVIPQMIRGG